MTTVNGSQSDIHENEAIVQACKVFIDVVLLSSCVLRYSAVLGSQTVLAAANSTGMYKSQKD